MVLASHGRFGWLPATACFFITDERRDHLTRAASKSSKQPLSDPTLPPPLRSHHAQVLSQSKSQPAAMGKPLSEKFKVRCVGPSNRVGRSSHAPLGMPAPVYVCVFVCVKGMDGSGHPPIPHLPPQLTITTTVTTTTPPFNKSAELRHAAARGGAGGAAGRGPHPRAVPGDGGRGQGVSAVFGVMGMMD